jgi:uncharacterized membrane protein
MTIKTLFIVSFMSVGSHCIKLYNFSKIGSFYSFVSAVDGSNPTVNPKRRKCLQSRSTNDDTVPLVNSCLSREDPQLDFKYDMKDVVSTSTNVITTSSSIILPFSASVAYDAFSDVTRQPTWSPWLYSVSYVEDRGNESLETEWIMKLFGFKYSWRAISTRLERPHLIEWISTSGLRNGGRVQFEPLVSKDGEGHCKMTMTMKFVAPTAIVRMVPNKIESLFQRVILKRTLHRFKEVIAAENASFNV